jgi:hypothetical protein
LLGGRFLGDFGPSHEIFSELGSRLNGQSEMGI